MALSGGLHGELIPGIDLPAPPQQSPVRVGEPGQLVVRHSCGEPVENGLRVSGPTLEPMKQRLVGPAELALLGQEREAGGEPGLDTR